MAPQAHTDKVFEAELGALRDKLLDMGGRVEAALSASVRSLVERDSALAEKVKQQDREINRWRWTSTRCAGACWRCGSRRRATCASSPPRSRS